MIALILSPFVRNKSGLSLMGDVSLVQKTHTDNTRHKNKAIVSMGPVVSSIVLYTVERFLNRLVAGQLLRKGVSRKIRRLVSMMVTAHVIYEVVFDMLEDMS
jgi:hypothetical protein